MDLWSTRRTMLVCRQEAHIRQGDQRTASSEGTITTGRGPRCRADIRRAAISRTPQIPRQEEQYPPVLGLGVPLAEINMARRACTGASSGAEAIAAHPWRVAGMRGSATATDHGAHRIG